MGLTYKYNTKYSYHHLKGLIPILLGGFIFIAFMVYKYGKEDLDIFFLYAFVGFFLCLILPTLVIHFTYYFYSRNDSLLIDFENQIIHYHHKNKKVVFKFAEIQKIDKYVTFPKTRNAEGWLPWDTFNYTILTLADKKILITCYIVEDIEKSISTKKVNIHKVIFPMLPFD